MTTEESARTRRLQRLLAQGYPPAKAQAMVDREFGDGPGDLQVYDEEGQLIDVPACRQRADWLRRWRKPDA